MRQVTKNTNGKGIGYHPYLDLTSNNCIFKDIVKSISNSLVLWYDIKKQQATNEGMAATPILRDLSGNGHDATCYNFAWSGMSGIGGYVQSNFNIRANNSSVFDVSVQGNIVTYQKNNGTVIEANSLVLYDSGTNWDRDIETKVKAGKYGLNVYATEPRGTNPKNILSLPPYETGSFTYAQSDYDDGKTAIMFGNTIEVPVGEANSFEFLPNYPNALVSDGVDDYAQVTGLPILTKEKGYTVIAKRDYIDLEGIVHNSVFLDKTGFEIETCLWAETNRFNTYSFGGRNILDGFTNELLVQTSKKYGQTDISTGTLADDSILDIFKGISRSWNGRIALYSLLLFDRDLTDNEIEWVKKNMIEGGGVMKYDWLSSSWYFFMPPNPFNGTGTFTSYKFVVKSVVKYSQLLRTFQTLPSMESYRIKVSNLPEGVNLKYSGVVNGKSTDILTISKDGIYEIPPIETESIYVGFSFDTLFENENVIIQQLLS